MLTRISLLLLMSFGITGACRAQMATIGNKPQIMVGQTKNYVLSVTTVRISDNPTYSIPDFRFQINPEAGNCELLRKRRRETRLVLIGVSSLGIVLMGVGLADAFNHFSIYGGGGGSLGGRFAGATGLLCVLGGGVGYAIAIPRLSKDYRQCRGK